MNRFNLDNPAGKVVQIAFVTDDVHLSMAELTQSMKVGPWFFRERGVFPNQRYRGEPAATALAIAMGYAGEMQFEIIQQLDDSPSVYRDVVGRKGFGLHHFGVAVDDFEAGCAHYRAEGFEQVYEAEVVHGARVAYFETFDRLPAMIEVIEVLPATQAMFAEFCNGAVGWDGADPVRIRPQIQTHA